MVLDLEPLGDRAFLARFPTEDAARAWAATVRNRAFQGVDDVVLAYRSTAVFTDPERCDLDSLERALRTLEPRIHDAEAGARHVVPVLYDGPDLAHVASTLSLSRDEVIDRHAGRDYHVFAVGFLPAFPYAGYLPRELSGLARRAEPRLEVAAGSVAIAGRQTGIYPSKSPGGWHLLGRTPLRIADPEAGRFPIRAGDAIRFQPIDRHEYEARLHERL
ncbi:5-oxoprolinase subunit B family protein [Paludisphaera borealis]|uniref:Kinase A inhibitor n=1 Tax=Paludisphaera borealis TaxID=1387353 RepID=A0A1U7CK58_9BACT|nr:allophanate hydrolase subunit 1 [Paludisphaera borealis]APW59324.1 Kinase A inhibitor [Paludisphaera borealis]